MQYAVVALMIIALIATFICAKKQKQKPSMKIGTLLCAIITVTACITYLRGEGVIGGVTPEMRRWDDSIARYAEAVAAKAAQTVSGKYQPSEIVIVTSDPAPEAGEEPSPSIKALRKAFGGDAVKIEYVTYPADAQNLDSAEGYNNIFEKHKDAKLFILASIPGDMRETARLSIWNDENKKAILLYLFAPDEKFTFVPAMLRTGKLESAVTMNPEASQQATEGIAPEGIEEAFAAKYLLLTPANIREIDEKFNFSAR